MLGEQEEEDRYSASTTQPSSPNTLHTTNFLFFSTGCIPSIYISIPIPHRPASRAADVVRRQRVGGEGTTVKRNSVFTSTPQACICQPLHHEHVFETCQLGPETPPSDTNPAAAGEEGAKIPTSHVLPPPSPYTQCPTPNVGGGYRPWGDR